MREMFDVHLPTSWKDFNTYIHVPCNVCTWRYKTIGDAFNLFAFTTDEMILCDDHIFQLVGSITNGILYTYIYICIE